MGSDFCRKNKTPLSFESRSSFICLPSVHFSVEIPILWALYIPHLLSPPGPSKRRPLALRLDLGPRLLSLSDPSCGSWQTSEPGSFGMEREKDRGLPFLTPGLLKTQRSCKKRSSLGTRIHASWKNYLLGKTCPKSRARVLLLSVPVCKNTVMQRRVLAQDPEIAGELGGTGEIKGLRNKRQQV